MGAKPIGRSQMLRPTNDAHTYAEMGIPNRAQASRLQRIAAVHPALNAVVQTVGPRARLEALAADQALARGELRGPLHGVPIVVKDLYDVAGVRTTGCCAAYLERDPAAAPGSAPGTRSAAAAPASRRRGSRPAR